MPNSVYRLLSPTCVGLFLCQLDGPLSKSSRIDLIVGALHFSITICEIFQH